MMLDASSKNILQGFNLNIKFVVQSGPEKRSEYNDTFLRDNCLLKYITSCITCQTKSG